MPFKEMKAFPGRPQLPHPDVVVTKQRDPCPHEHSVYTACSCPALTGLLRNRHRCIKSHQEIASPSTADSSPPTPEPLSVQKVCSPASPLRAACSPCLSWCSPRPQSNSGHNADQANPLLGRNTPRGRCHPVSVCSTVFRLTARMDSRLRVTSDEPHTLCFRRVFCLQ